MKAWQWVVLIFTWLVCLAFSAAGVLLMTIFFGSASENDQMPGIVVGIGSVLWLALPVFGTWLIRKKPVVGAGVMIGTLVVTFGALWFMLMAMGAAVQP